MQISPGEFLKIHKSRVQLKLTKKMKKSFLPIFLMSALGFTSLTGCKKEGCTNGIATNYDSKAKKDDGSCVYDASVQFWYDETASDDMDADGITDLTVYVNDAEIGSYSVVDDFSDAAPACGESGIISKKFNLGSAVKKTISYSIEDQDGQVVDEGTIELDAANKCTSFQIEYTP